MSSTRPSLLRNAAAAKGALITGASSGLGAEFARQLAARGVSRLLLLARRRDRLEKLREELIGRFPELQVEVLVADLTDPSGRFSLCRRLAAGEFDILVNNAGFGTVGSFVAADPARQRAMVQTNLSAPFELLQSALFGLSPDGPGLIINVCSTAAFQPMPYMATYGATKAFLLSLSVALAAELGNSGIQIVAHCPGPTESEFHLAAGLEKKLSHLPAAPTAAVITELLDAVARGSTYRVTGWRNRLLATAVRLLAPPVSARIVAAKLVAAGPKER